MEFSMEAFLKSDLWVLAKWNLEPVYVATAYISQKINIYISSVSPA